MNYEISLTASRAAAVEETNEFTNIMTSKGFRVMQGETRGNYSGDRVYINFTISTESRNNKSSKGGRPHKLSEEQLREIKSRLSEKDCNKSALAREYGVSYQTIHKLSMT